MWLIFFFLPCFLCANWADETLSQMTLEEKVGQLFVAPACPMREKNHWEDWLQLFSTCRIGNVLVKQADVPSQIRFLTALQQEAKYPLLVAADFEWGLAMTMKGEMAFPRNEVLGAKGDAALIFAIGREIGRQAPLVGVHLNLAPVADVNNNPENRVIGTRSFGSDPHLVARDTLAYLQGVQSSGLLACAKHFPGHGDTNVDSHRALPCIPHSKERLDQGELVPFRQAIAGGVAAVMTGHLLVPCVDPHWPATLSFSWVTGFLRGEMGFDGLIVTDALNMEALTLAHTPEDIALLAHQAGCDLLLYGAHLSEKVDALMREQIPRAYRALLRAYQEGRFDEKRLNQSVLRILQAKERVGLALSREIPPGDLHTEEAEALLRSCTAF